MQQVVSNSFCLLSASTSLSPMGNVYVSVIPGPDGRREKCLVSTVRAYTKLRSTAVVGVNNVPP